MNPNAIASSLSKRRRTSPLARATDSTDSEDGSSDSSSSSSSAKIKVFSRRKQARPTQLRSIPSQDASGSQNDFRPDQFEESAILWAIDDIGLQNATPDIVAIPSPMPSSSSTDDDASSISDEPPVVVAPIERTSDYSSSSSEDGDDDGVSEHFDFMEAAVAAAIQKKGLLPQSMETSPSG